MSFKQKKRSLLETDNLNLKSHLNTSLETEGISVSEDLINRTLDAIKRQNAGEKDIIKEEVKHKEAITFVKRHSRFLVTAAAAVIILVAGMNAIRLFTPEKKMDRLYKSDNAYKSSELTDDANFSANYMGSEAETNVKTDKDDADAIAEHDSGATVGMFTEASDKIVEFDMKTTSSGRYDLKFIDITSMEVLDVKSATITSMASGKVLDISEDLDRFYSLMDNHAFYSGAEEVSEGNYIISLIGENSDSQIIIGETFVAVDHTDNDIASHSIFSVADHSKLVEDLKELLEE